jgi:hypothetical protein
MCHLPEEKSLVKAGEVLLSYRQALGSGGALKQGGV